MKKDRVTIFIMPEIWKKFRMDCLKRDLSASEAVEQLVKEYLKNVQTTDII